MIKGWFCAVSHLEFWCLSAHRSDDAGTDYKALLRGHGVGLWVNIVWLSVSSVLTGRGVGAFIQQVPLKAELEQWRAGKDGVGSRCGWVSITQKGETGLMDYFM